jgi:FkbM family methyltransferase
VLNDVKHAFYEVMRARPVNWFARPILKTLSNSNIYSQGGFIYPVQGVLPVRFRNKKIFSMKTDGSDTIAARAYLWGAEGFETETLDCFANEVAQAKVFLDIGANTGFYTLLASALNQDLISYSFEPVPSINQVLRSNILLNGMSRVQVEDCALGESEQEIEFYVPKSIRIATGGSASAAHRKDTEIFKVKQTTLDNFKQKRSLPKVDLMKIDTESTEPQVLAGAMETLRKDHPTIICEILQKKTAERIAALLKPLNYEFYHLTLQGIKKVQNPAEVVPSPYFNFLIK